MSLNKMVVGKKYLVGDGYGYEKVECLEINPAISPYIDQKGICVKVRCIDSNREDYFFVAAKNYGYTVSVVEYNE